MKRNGDELDQEIRKIEREVQFPSHECSFNDTLDCCPPEYTKASCGEKYGLQRILSTGRPEQRRFVEICCPVHIIVDIQAVKELDEQYRIDKDALFRKKRELQRLTTDLEEDTIRFDQVSEQASRISEQNDHLRNAKEQVEKSNACHRDLLIYIRS